MSSIYAIISSNLMKKTIPLYALSSASSTTRASSLLQTFNSVSSKKICLAYDKQTFVYALAKMCVNGPDKLPAKSPPEVPTAPSIHTPGTPPEVPWRPNVPDFDAIPLENPADPPPISPGPRPEFPGPPNPSPPKPEGPQPPIPPPPGGPEVFPPHWPDVLPPMPPEPGEGMPPPPKPEIDPPHGPDTIPPKPPEPGFPHPTQPDLPPPITM